MSNEIKVTQQGMSQLIDRLHEAIQRIETILRGLDENVEKLRGGWTGEASDAYDRAQRAWATQLNDMNELLAYHRRETIQTAENFQNAVRKNQQTWS